MKTKMFVLSGVLLGSLLLQGCVGLPSLVHVEHKHSHDPQAVAQRLDSIEKRLTKLEQHTDKAP